MEENQNNNSVTEVSPIETALAAQNVTAQVIQSLKDKYMVLKISGIDDTTGFKMVDLARKECKSIRVLAKKICETGREKAIKEQKDWIAKEKEVTGQIAEIEDYLEAQTNAIKEQKEKLLFEYAQKQKLPGRIEKLAAIGITVPDEKLLEINDEQYQALYNEFYEAHLKQKEKELEEQKQKLAAEEKERQEKEAARIKAEEDEKERLRLEAIEKENKRLKEEETKRQEAEKEKQRIANERLEKRSAELRDLGLIKQSDLGMASDYTKLFLDQIVGPTDEKWNEVILYVKQLKEKHEQALRDKAASDELERKAKAEADAKLKAETEAREKAEKELEAKKKSEAEAKAKSDADAKAKIAAERKALAAPDKEKLKIFVNSLTWSEQKLSTPDAITINQQLEEEFYSFKKSALSIIETL